MYQNLIKEHVTIYPSLDALKADLPAGWSLYPMDLSSKEDLYSRLDSCAQTTKVAKDHFGNSDDPSWVKRAYDEYFKTIKIAVANNVPYFMQAPTHRVAYSWRV